MSSIWTEEFCMYIVFEVPKDKARQADKALKDNIVSRQSIVVRDARTLDVDKDAQFVLIEGSEEGISTAKDLFAEIGSPLNDAEGKVIYDKIKAQDEAAADGVGMIFGD
jgi:hypothetical protein